MPSAGVALDQVDEEQCVLVGAEQVPSVKVAFAPGLLGALDELPVVEARAEATRDGLRMLGALVVAEAIIGEAEALWKHPAFAVILGQEGVDAHLTVAAGGLDLRFEVAEGDEGQDGVAEFRVLVFVDAPESLRIERLQSIGTRNRVDRNVAIPKAMVKLVILQPEHRRNQYIKDSSYAKAFVHLQRNDSQVIMIL